MNIDKQYRRPTGIIGGIIGKRMARQHQQENIWTVSLLKAQPTDHILEVGFGPGIAIEHLAALTTQGYIVGIDFSHAMVRAARKRNLEAIKAGRVSLHYGDVINLPFGDNTFDKALGVHTLYFWSDPISALAEIKRVIKPGGVLALTILPKEQWPGSETGTGPCLVYTGNDVMKLMMDAGFTSTCVEMGPETKPFREISVIGMI